MDRHTVIEDAPQVSVRRIPPQLQPRSFALSPMSDSFPTPKAHRTPAPLMELISDSPTTSDTHSDENSMWSKRTSESVFDEMYDISESESEGEVPIKLSHSIKKRIVMGRHNYPPLVISSPSEWPTIDKMKTTSTPLSPIPKIDLAPSILTTLRSGRVPSTSSTPSLDGNSTDEELALSSCPSTPEVATRANDDSTWEVPIQLDPSSISLLRRIHGAEESEPLETVIEVPEEEIQEMRQVVESPRQSQRMRLETQNLTPAHPIDGAEELSDLSIPTPGGFFASLSTSAARHTWCANQRAPPTSVATEFYDVPFRSATAEPPPTSTATRFYNLPWQNRSGSPVQQIITIDTELTDSPEPVTAKRIGFSPVDGVIEVDEIDEKYNDSLKESAAASLDRTMLWLHAQTDYMKAVCKAEDEDYVDDDLLSSFKDLVDAVPKTPEQKKAATLEHISPKKTVRWADEKPTALEEPPVAAEAKQRISPIHDGTFWEGWRHTKRSQRARDVFLHRQARAEAEHVKRTSSHKQHMDQLQGKYQIICTDRPAPSRPISDLLAKPGEDDKADVITRAERERQALEQMQSSSWHLAAHKEIAGGKLLTSPIVQSFKGRTDVRILDVDGQVHCGWSWNVALEHPDAAVYTTVSSDAEAHVAQSALDGPANHCVVAAPKPWELPFADNHFDIISARNLYANLKTVYPQGQAADEWDLTLRECLRCLKPGGYLEFNLLDAELAHPEPACQALGVEFAFSLKTRGYDPCSGRTFLPRLKRAGFESIKRAWMILPVADVIPRWQDLGKTSETADAVAMEKIIGPNGEESVYAPAVVGSTRDVRAMTGLVGARMWEQWILKLHCEMGREEARGLEGVAKALEECGKGNAGWRCLVGWARKGAGY